jgi:beta-N-acetylhexosaminidase
LNTALELTELKEKVGRLIMTGIPGPNLDEDTHNLIRDYNLAGIILFSRNIIDPIQLAELCREIQQTAIKYHANPLFIAIDQEGGNVTRLKKPFSQFPGNEAIGKDEHPLERAREFAEVTAKEMKLVGLNMNLAPVVDVARGDIEKHLRGRLFSNNPQKVALLGRTIAGILQKKGILAAAKHFPGLGRASVDPHLELPIIEIEKNELDEVNFPPFNALIDEDVSSVMTSHAIYPCLDRDNPATLSPKILEGILRKELSFKGMIITDDLEMGAIAKKWGVAKGALASFMAGADILLICKDQKNVLESISLITKEVLVNNELINRLDESNRRVSRAKSRFLKKQTDISLKEIRGYFGPNLSKKT